MKIRKVLFLIVIAVIMFCVFTYNNYVEADPVQPVVGVRTYRNPAYDPVNSAVGYRAYSKIVWKLVEYLDATGSPLAGGTVNWNKAIYCLAAGVGFTSDSGTEDVRIKYTNFSTMTATPATPPFGSGQSELMKEALEKSENASLLKVLQEKNLFGAGLSAEKNNAVLWILNHMYLPEHQDVAQRQAMRDQLLINALVNNPVAVDVDTLADVLLTDNDIEVVQQLAIWYFTVENNAPTYNGNQSPEAPNMGTLECKTEGMPSFIENPIGGSVGDQIDIHKQASWLYDYFVNQASANAASYTGERSPTITVQAESSAKIEESGTYTWVGPIKYTVTEADRLYDYEITVEARETAGGAYSETTNYTIYKQDKITQVTNIADIAGENFYVRLDSPAESVRVKINAKYLKTTATKWEEGNEQPIVIVEKEEDEIEDEVIITKEPDQGVFDLALRKFITGVNDGAITSRVPVFTITPSGVYTYVHPKDPIGVQNGDLVTYTIRVYNEGDLAGYAQEITDYIPDGLEFVITNSTNLQYRWILSADGNSITTDYLSMQQDVANLLQPFDEGTMTEPDYKEVKVVFKVVEPNTSTRILKNIAEISEDSDENGDPVDDIDSTPDNVDPNDYTNNEEDDDDYEQVILKYFDLALRKFIHAVTEDNPSRTVTYNRTPVVTYVNGKLVYTHSKDPVKVKNDDLVHYTIRVYNEGSLAGYVEEIVDYLPEGLEFVPDHPTNLLYRWKMYKIENGVEVEITDPDDAGEARVLRTDYLSRGQNVNNLLNPFDEASSISGTNPSYKDVQVVCRVVAGSDYSGRLKNIAEISEDSDENGDPVEDIDSTPDNVDPDDYTNNEEDDDDYEEVVLGVFDLSLRKFITAVNDTEITSRIPVVTKTDALEHNGLKYEHPKTPVEVANTDVVIYTIRVYNEGDISGYAQEITDDVPDGLKFLPNHEINQEYRWVLSEDEAMVTTDYLSKEQNVDNLIRGFRKNDPIVQDGSDPNPDFKEVKIAFEVVSREITSPDRIVKNTAEITEDADSNGEDIDDADSTPGNWEPEEDDIDEEFIYVKYFDLALLKYVSRIIIIEDGKTSVTETGYNGLENPNPVPKVEIDKKKLNSVVVKFAYTIKVTNEGEIAGYAKEVTDRIPEGLKFIPEDNPGWYIRDGERIVATRALENTLLQPGESATVEIILTWINGEKNLGQKINIAEISEDYNDKDEEDIDSTPDNNVPEEDDQDDAPVILTIKTGKAGTYITLTSSILTVLGVGIFLIKRYVL